MVETHDVVKHFKDQKGNVVAAVDGISLRAPAGQITGLLGVNGAGKTTLLRILSTVIHPSSGSATVAGFDTQTQSAQVRANIGFMSNSTALYGRLTAREVIEYFGGLYGLDGKDLQSRVDEVMERLNIGSYADRLCDKLSTGQKQRVSIARTILHDPPVLFFDEPTSGLDVVTSQIVMEFVESARAQGKAVFYCTHIMSEAERVCDQIYVIHGGKIRGEGTVQDLLSQTGTSRLEQAFLALVDFSGTEEGKSVEEVAHAVRG